MLQIKGAKNCSIHLGDMSNCFYNDFNWDLYTVENFNENLHNGTEGELKRCSRWKYDTSQYQSTIVTQVLFVYLFP